MDNSTCSTTKNRHSQKHDNRIEQYSSNIEIVAQKIGNLIGIVLNITKAIEM